MARRWHEGEQPLAEEYLSRHPELCGQSDAVVRLIYEEICLRQERGQETASMEVVQRFPQWREQLEDILCHPFPKRLQMPRMPEVGESLGGFRLLAELGHGIRGRVFLASQPALADRPVVLKITSCDGGEHRVLARLQHTHVVPIYSVQDFLDRNLRILCMPYFGGATLSQIAERLRAKQNVDGDKTFDQFSGQDLLDALDQVSPTVAPTLPARGPCRQILTQLSYTRAICWIASCLADALEYAHERGLVHLDLKPSNVLLAADGQPMLLDFHLSQQPLRPHDPPPTWLGGTPAYMSPEQKAAVLAMREGRSVKTAVDGRSDIYSLGILLDEALGGFLREPRQDTKAREAAAKTRSLLTPGLEDLIRKCLQPIPSDRYRTAAAVGADLRRYLGDLPLHGVSNRSWSERWHKWRRRRPYALSLYGLSLAFMVAAAAAGLSALNQISHRYHEAQQDLMNGQAQMGNGEWEGAIQTFTHGISRAHMIPFSHDLQQDLTNGLQLARQNKAAHDFHLVADRIRIRSVADSLSDRELRDLEASCQAAWDSLPLIAQRLPDLEEKDRQKVRRDFLDLAVLGADLRVRLASAREMKQAQESALQVLEEAEATIGPSSVIQAERQTLTHGLGLKSDSGTSSKSDESNRSPQTSWECCARGRSFLQAGKLDVAAREFKEAVRLEPGGLWPNYYAGVCAHRLGRSKEALQAFSVCVGAASATTEGREQDTKSIQAQILFNRALAYSGAGGDREALEDYNRALELDPTIGRAALNRGLLHFKLQRYQQAIADLNLALADGMPPASVHFNLALVYQAQKNRAAALASVRRALECEPNHKDAQALLNQLAR
jgi:serine/threonine protein kinase/Flp pilus assembly protein TadD